MKKIATLLIFMGFLAAAIMGGIWAKKNLPLPAIITNVLAPAAHDPDAMPYPAQYAKISGLKTYYVTAGQGQPFVFLHGNPTQSYMWRNVLPYVAEVGKIYAFDWPGYGYSEKPYPPLTHQDYDHFLSAFLDDMQLEKVVLVIHDWSSMVAFHYAAQHPERIAGLVFMESLVPPIIPIENYESLGKVGNFFKNVREIENGAEVIVKTNTFVDLMLETGFEKPLSAKAQAIYKEAFKTPQQREVLLRWPNLLPIGGKPTFMHDRVHAYGTWFLNSPEIPKLFLYAEPGLFNKPAFADYYAEHMPEVTSVSIGRGYHYIQEENADRIGKAIAAWAQKNVK